MNIQQHEDGGVIVGVDALSSVMFPVMLAETEKERKLRLKENGIRHRQGETYKITNALYLQSEGYKANQRRYYYESIRGRLSAMFKTCKSRAKYKGWPFSITREFLINKYMSYPHCEVTGDAFSLEYPGVGKPRNPYGPSIDQKIPGLGYTLENVQLVVLWYNNFKNNMTDSQALEILRKTKAGKC